MPTRQLCCIVLYALFYFTGSSRAFALEGELRTWVDSTGKNKIKAKFVKLEDGTVTLENEDGDEIEIPLKKLSANDQEVALKASKEPEDSPFKAKSSDPFKSKSKSKGKGAKNAEPADEDDEAPTKTRKVTAKLSSARQLLLSGPSSDWKVEVPVREERTENLKLKPIALPPKTNFFEGLKSIAISRSPEHKVAAVGFLFDRNNDGGTVRVVLCNLATGKAEPAATASGKLVPIAVHDDGKQVLMRREEFGFGNQDRLEVWKLDRGKVSKIVSWVPYDEDQGAARDVMWAQFIDPQRLATSSRGGKIAVWSYPEIEPQFSFSTEDGAIPALSPDRKFIAFSNGSDIGVFDIAEEQVAAQQSAPSKLQWPQMAYSPSGKKLACLAFDKILVWDVATGSLEKTVPCTGLHVHGNIEFVDDKFVLAGSHYLIDLENQLKLWTYDGGEQVRSIDGITLFGITDGEKKPGALIPVQLPHKQALDLLKKALTDPNLFVLKSGTSVRIDVNGIPDAAQRERVAKGLKQQLDTIGCKGGTTGTIDIVATVEGPKDTKLRYINSGEYNFKEYTMRVKFVYQGQPAWESASTNGPGFVVHLGAGENMESFLRKHEKPNYEFFEHVQLPKFLQKPAAGQGAGNSLTIGRSQVTTGGIR